MYEEKEEREYPAPAAARLRVENGDPVHAGQQLTEGSRNPQDILRIMGPESVQLYLVEEVQKVYRSFRSVTALDGIDLAVRAGEFLFVQLMLATVLGLAGALLGWQSFGGPLAALAGGMIGLVAPLGWLRYRVGQRRNAFEQGLPEALDRVTGALRAGYGLEFGFDLVAREGAPPCSEEFGQILQELNLGGDLEEALARLILRINSEDARLLATAVAVQRRTGGNLVEVLGQMSHVLRERERLRRDVRVITTAPRVSGYVVALLPLLTVVAMYVTSRYYIDTLFSEPIGRVAAAVGGLLVL